MYARTLPELDLIISMDMILSDAANVRRNVCKDASIVLISPETCETVSFAGAVIV